MPPIKKYFSYSSGRSVRILKERYTNAFSSLLTGPSLHGPALPTHDDPSSLGLRSAPFPASPSYIDRQTHEEACRLALQMHINEEGLPSSSSSSSSSSSEDDMPMPSTASTTTTKRAKPGDSAINIRELRRARRALEMVGVATPNSSPEAVLRSAVPLSTQEQEQQGATSTSTSTQAPASARVVLCTGKKCARRGAQAALAHLETLAADPSVQPTLTLKTACSGCQGLCGKAPVMRVKLQGASQAQLYAGVAGNREVEEALAYSLLVARQQNGAKSPPAKVEVEMPHLD